MEHETGPDEAGWPDVGSASMHDGPDDHAADTPGAESAAGAPGTGEPRVDAALRLLDRLPGLPVSEHPGLFEQVHAQLSEVLGELDSGQSSPPGQHAS